MRRLKPPHVIILSFLLVVLAGTVFLSLPFATRSGDNIGFIDRLFTATSAVCVTGLVVRDTAAWAPFGRFIIMLLFQAGGLGIMTFSTFFAILLGRKVTIRDGLVVKGTLGGRSSRNLKTLLLYIILIVFLCEAVGAVCLFIRWRAIENWPLSETVYNSIFHSISAFCNAGFSLFKGSFTAFGRDPYINLIMMALIFIGGIGFIVILEAWKLATERSDKRPFFSRMSVQTKIALSMSLFLIILGALAIFLLERKGALIGLGTGGKVLGAFFQAVTARTAGFNTLPINKLATPTLLTLIFLMFIGASPGSTGGGIKTCTFAAMFAGVVAMIKNKDRVWMFKKTIPKTVVRKAITIFIMALGWIFLFSLLLSITERGSLAGEGYYLRILFETTSAFGTVGLSTGITSALSAAGKILIILTMFVGRVGPLTLALAVALQEERLLYNYPEEEIMVG